jgi:hypothetical protein
MRVFVAGTNRLRIAMDYLDKAVTSSSQRAAR